MRTETIQYFSEKEDEFVNLLIDIGTKKNVATLLVFLANVPDTSSRSIERGTDLRQPEVSIAMKYLIDRGWVTMKDDLPGHKGRPKKIYHLALPITEIMDSIEEEKKSEVRDQLALIRKVQDYIR
ncbi:MAG: ArsR family transcriptional regulator [Methanoregula sp.]